MNLKEKNIVNEEHIEKIDAMYEKISTVFSSEVANNITQAKFQLTKNNNMYFIAKYLDTWVQIRIPSDGFLSLFENEYELAKTLNDYLFIKNGIFIKKWFPGSDLFQIGLESNLINPILNCLKKFQERNVEIKKFNWNKYNIKDKRYQKLVKKYSNDELVLSHNNIRKNNIIINKFGYIKLVDFEAVTLNSKYYDLVALYFNIGIDKKTIIDFFNLDKEKFNDYVYLFKRYKEAHYQDIYLNIKNIQKKMPSPHVFLKNNQTINNKFIVFKKHNKFNYHLNLSELENFYFVPTYIYEDENKIIWRWLNNKGNFELSLKSIKLIAKIMKTYHDSHVNFPDFVLDKYIKWLIKKTNIVDFKKEMDDFDLIKLIFLWLKQIKIDANCHNNLSFKNILWGENQNIYFIDWSLASKGSRFLDIAIMFENLNVNKVQKELFWAVYCNSKPIDFYKYQIIALFLIYLQNKQLKNHDEKNYLIIKKIKYVLIKNRIKVK